MITSKNVTSHVRTAHLTAEKPGGVTLTEVADFLAEARRVGIPGDTPIIVTGFILPATTSFVSASATVEEDAAQ